MSNEPENQAVGTELSDEDLRAVENVRAVLKSLTKFINGKKIYAKNNPTLVKFAKEFDAALQSFYENENELILDIDQYRITWRDQVVYESDKREESIAFLLYKDGIGEIGIQNSVTTGELEQFVDLIKDEMHNFSPGEDIVTKLWKSDFDSITYRVLDEYLVGEFGEGKRDESEATLADTDDHPDLPSFEDRGREIVEGTDNRNSITGCLNDLIDQNYPRESIDEREERFQDLADSFFMVSSEELRMCHEELSREAEGDALVQFLKAIVEFALLKENPSVVRDTTNIVESIVDYLAAEADPRVLLKVLRIIRTFMRDHPLDEKAMEFFESVEEKLVDTTFLSAVAEGMKEGMAEPEDVFSYYRAVGRRAAPTICTIMEDLETANLHRLACDTLIAIARDDLPRVIDTLSIDVPRVARDAIYLIEAIAEGEVPDLVEELMYYPDNRVREEVVKYLARNGTEDAVMLLVALLDDDDKHIRMTTLTAIENLEGPVLRNKLVALAFDKESGKRDGDEKERVFKLAGKYAGNDIIPQIRKMVEKKNWFPFGRDQGKQDKLLAIAGLESIPTEESISFLEDLAEDPNDVVKSRARRALRVIQEMQGKQEHGRSQDNG